MGIRTNLHVYADTVGDQSGSTEANVDGSVTPVAFKVNGQDRTHTLIQQIIVSIEYTGFAPEADEYGNLTELTNGVEFGIFDKVTNLKTLDFCGFGCVKKNSQWASLLPNYNVVGGQPSTCTSLHFGVQYASDIAPMIINQDEYLGAIINDDLSSLIMHRYFVKGYVRDY